MEEGHDLFIYLYSYIIYIYIDLLYAYYIVFVYYIVYIGYIYTFQRIEFIIFKMKCYLERLREYGDEE